MKRTTFLASFLFLHLHSAHAQYDVFEPQREMIHLGVQAVLTCNGLFTSNRTIEQINAQELKYIPGKFGIEPSKSVHIDKDIRGVAISNESGVTIRAIFRDGIGCVVLRPDQDFSVADTLPRIDLAPAPKDYATTPWPMGDATAEYQFKSATQKQAMDAVADWAFNTPTDEQDTLSLVIVHRGNIMLERYAEGVNRDTKTRTWSTAKSVFATLAGIKIDRKEMAVTSSLNLEWSPQLANPEADPRHKITLGNALQMSSGLYPVDSFNMEYANGSGLAYWAGESSAAGAVNRGLVREPGTFWDYENYDTLLATMSFKNTFDSVAQYHQFPSRELFNKLGMYNTLVSTDQYGDFIFSSQMYTTARDLARFGMLYVNGGKWFGEQIISPQWLAYSTTPAPASATRGYDYGAQWWLRKADKNNGPAKAFTTRGNRGQFVVVIPEKELVIVRRGLDYGKQGFNPWELADKVLEALDK
ncbi:serine hydrolase domain-containing protein [Pseudoalteromonas sp. T1lg10]|uniref:serine hydrolase domain-containing protein n=1 Tax=Pseudoalteromonas sp. T1lg10 TaxID=2077093 RepID=UPI000CF74A27|nr:serine hydrolase [Pseudoalteromonas sp. T1lg10]